MIPAGPRWPVVLLDVDGTLVDSIGLIVESYQYAFRTVLGHPWDEAEIKTWIGQSLYESMRRDFPDHADELVAAYREWNHAHADERQSGYPGMRELVVDLGAAGVRMGAVTSKRRPSAQRSLDVAGLTDLVPLLIAHDDVDECKPSPKPLLAALKELGGRPAECVYVGDAVVDVQAAKHAEMSAVAVTWGAGTKKALEEAAPTAICDTAAELRRILLPDWEPKGRGPFREGVR